MKKILILFFLIPNLAFAIDKNTLSKKFKNYSNDYQKLNRECAPNIRKGIMAGMDLQNCIWDKDRILLYKYDFNNSLYDSSYQRYGKLFKLFKSFAVEESRDFEGLARQEIYLIEDSLNLQENIILNYYGF